MKNERINPYKKFLGAMLPNWLLRRHEISAGSKLCYARLAQYAGKRGFSFPAHSTLSRELGISRDSIVRYIRELKEHDLIETERSNKRYTLTYYFLIRLEWVKPGDYRKRKNPR